MTRLEYTGHFDSAHWLPHYEGKCHNLHGHRWTYTIVFEGEPDRSGMLIDFAVIKKKIDTLYDHRALNGIVSNPTAEEIAKSLYKLFPYVKEVSLWESPNAKITYYERDI